jgi:hypothetical protein
LIPFEVKLIATALVVPGAGVEPVMISVDATVPPLPVKLTAAQPAAPLTEQLRRYGTPATVFVVVTTVDVPGVPLAGLGVDSDGACTVRVVVATVVLDTMALNVSVPGGVLAAILSV